MNYKITLLRLREMLYPNLGSKADLIPISEYSHVYQFIYLDPMTFAPHLVVHDGQGIVLGKAKWNGVEWVKDIQGEE